jgi:hypothetical protein
LLPIAHYRKTARGSCRAQPRFRGISVAAYLVPAANPMPAKKSDAQCGAYLQAGWPFITVTPFPGGHPFCGTTFGVGAGAGFATLAAGAIGFDGAGGVTGAAAGT